MDTRRFVTNLLAGLSCVVVLNHPIDVAQAIEDEDEEDVQFETDRFQTHPGGPRRHFRLRQVVQLDPGEADRIYGLINDALAKGFGFSGFEGADKYQSFKRYNKAPYLSSTHGNLFLNNYANQIADKYGEGEQAGQ